MIGKIFLQECLNTHISFVITAADFKIFNWYLSCRILNIRELIYIRRLQISKHKHTHTSEQMLVRIRIQLARL